MTTPIARSYSYRVTADQIRAFSALSDERKIAWIEEWQRATWEAATPETRASWWRLRGKEIPDHPDFRNAPAQNEAASR